MTVKERRATVVKYDGEREDGGWLCLKSVMLVEK